MTASSLFTLSQAQQTYLDAFMNRVSRSFALVVPLVEEPFTHYLATAYLICRVADNIEDCTREADWQNERFAELETLLHSPALATEILGSWESKRWPGLTPDEKRMMGVADGLGLWQIYANFPPRPQQIIRRWVTEMITGMSQVNDPASPPRFIDRNGIKITNAEQDYNSYCYYVAGTVGYMATALAVDHYQFGADVAARLLTDCEACGRALQKTNIIKDFSKDLKRQISYLPDEWMQDIDYSPLTLSNAPLAWKHRIIHNVLQELDAGLEYVLNLPYSAAGYRMATLLSILPAYQTLRYAANNHQTLFTVDHYVKISRDTMMACMQNAKAITNDNDAIRRYKVEATQAIEAAFARSKTLSTV